jgi:hypothetical protein
VSGIDVLCAAEVGAKVSFLRGQGGTGEGYLPGRLYFVAVSSMVQKKKEIFA